MKNGAASTETVFDKRVRGVKDLFSFDLTRTLKVFSDSPTVSRQKLITDMIDAATRQRIAFVQHVGVKPDHLHITSTLCCGGRISQVAAVLKFEEKADGGFDTILSGDQRRRLTNVEKYFNRFLN